MSWAGGEFHTAIFFHLSSMSLELSIPRFPRDSHLFMTRARKAARAQIEEGVNCVWQSKLFPPLLCNHSLFNTSNVLYLVVSIFAIALVGPGAPPELALGHFFQGLVRACSLTQCSFSSSFRLSCYPFVLHGKFTERTSVNPQSLQRSTLF